MESISKGNIDQGCEWHVLLYERSVSEIQILYSFSRLEWSLLAPPATNTDRSTALRPNWDYIFNLLNSFRLFEPIRVDHVLTARHFRVAEAEMRHIGAREKENFSWFRGLVWKSYEKTYEFRLSFDFHQSVARCFRHLYQMMTADFWIGTRQSFRKNSSTGDSKFDSYPLPCDHYKIMRLLGHFRRWTGIQNDLWCQKSRIL